MTRKGKKFRDPIHGFIYFSPEELEIINSPIFQRTRNIRQLSLGHYVYHGAEHSRFGHMIGASHIAGWAFDSLERNTKELDKSFKTDDTDRATLRMAALLHDIGHTPFSHALEGVLGSAHEEYSQKLISVCFEDALKNANVDVKKVNELIGGIPYSGKPYLSKIISGQLDVDRLDYLLRDSYYCGVSYGRYDLGRIIDQLAIVDNKFVVLHGGYEAVEQLIFARYQMYQQVYFHKTKRIFELMLRKCGEILKNAGEIKYPEINELDSSLEIEKYTQYDDRWFLNLIFQSSNPKVQIIADMIKKREPYWEVYSPNTFRNTSNGVKMEPYDPTPKLEPIQTALANNLNTLKVEEHEFLMDDASRPLYNLMPDYIISDSDGKEGNSISIYYQNNDFTEPIEKRSNVVYTLGSHQSSLIRGFVIPDKYNVIKEYLEKTFSIALPERGHDNRIEP